jgi:ParB family chromosome partitioning protein
VYREGEMTLEQLMAFTVSADHDAQERVWSEQLETSPPSIRRALTEAWVEPTPACCSEV